MSRVPSLAEARRRAEATRRVKPDIEAPSGPAAIRALRDAINAGKIPSTYVSGGSVVAVEKVSGTSGAAAGDEDSPLPVTASEVRAPELAALLAEHTYTYRLRSRRTPDGGTETYEEEVTPPPQVLNAALAPKEWPELRPLLGIVGAPVLRPDGTLLQQPGYDPATACTWPARCRSSRCPTSRTAGRSTAAREFLLAEVPRRLPVGQRGRQGQLPRPAGDPDPAQLPAHPDPVRRGHLDHARVRQDHPDVRARHAVRAAGADLDAQRRGAAQGHHLGPGRSGRHDHLRQSRRGHRDRLAGAGPADHRPDLGRPAARREQDRRLRQRPGMDRHRQQPAARRRHADQVRPGRPEPGHAPARGAHRVPDPGPGSVDPRTRQSARWSCGTSWSWSPTGRAAARPGVRA